MQIKAAISSLARKFDNSILKEYSERSKKPLVYTSFDGDYMSFLHHMLIFCKANGYIAINPEASLGYYVSTTTHGNSKVPVMLDCIAMELLCDEMWVFNPLHNHIPEGVLAEMMIWEREKSKGILAIPFFDSSRLAVPSAKCLEDIATTLYSAQDILKYVAGRDPSDRKAIETKLIANGNQSIPKPSYIVANFLNFKHIDWARAYCYKNGCCPVSPQNIIPFSLYADSKHDAVRECIFDRLTLLDKCDRLLWFTNTKQFENEIAVLDIFSSMELLYFAQNKGWDKIEVVDWKNAGVPKYASPDKWALTDTEKTEVIGLNDDTVDNSIDFNYENVRANIISYEKTITNDYNIFKGNLLGEAERQLITGDPNAFLLGLISDQSVKAELAWSLPYRLGERIGKFDISIIANMPIEELEKQIKDKPALHRYPSNMAKYIQAACKKLIGTYRSSAANIWSDGVSAAEIVKRLEDFKGISHKKAALGTLLLVRDLGLSVTDKHNINLAYDVHIRRICLRTGFAKKDSIDEVTRVGQSIFPDFPGRLTSSFWAIGRDICRPTSPDCLKCPIDADCAHKTELGGDINA
ncbi:hypothetical protein LJC34_00235 [Oscillospiraceae bacterium OttesenSCG-928-G22]|nr:hypothetical protein [Oscillospiraceae bacterium OttesenSCG-928-G22]